MERRSGTFCCLLHCNSAWVHQSVCGRQLRQRGHRHLCPHVHLLPLGQGSQDWCHLLCCPYCTLLLLHGVCLGWLCVHHQPHPASCFCASDHEPVFESDLYSIHHLLHPGSFAIHANPLRWLPASENERAHGFGWCLRAAECLCPAQVPADFLLQV
uniref:Uncharacterized protein n=1 Tax=Ixodes ricinus TaxID=34613 RepID=A0A147BVM4_IXORI